MSDDHIFDHLLPELHGVMISKQDINTPQGLRKYRRIMGKLTKTEGDKAHEIMLQRLYGTQRCMFFRDYTPSGPILMCYEFESLEYEPTSVMAYNCTDLTSDYSVMWNAEVEANLSKALFHKEQYPPRQNESSCNPM